MVAACLLVKLHQLALGIASSVHSSVKREVASKVIGHKSLKPTSCPEKDEAVTLSAKRSGSGVILQAMAIIAGSLVMDWCGPSQAADLIHTGALGAARLDGSPVHVSALDSRPDKLQSDKS